MDRDVAVTETQESVLTLEEEIFCKVLYCLWREGAVVQRWEIINKCWSINLSSRVGIPVGDSEACGSRLSGIN